MAMVAADPFIADYDGIGDSRSGFHGAGVQCYVVGVSFMLPPELSHVSASCLFYARCRLGVDGEERRVRWSRMVSVLSSDS